ncbi:ABC transporter permease [Streptomyces sp. NPDC058256]|uniref:ABC transporter permease n=1 Tax=Streptomyces sp. NPDC058256 TaxID=3346408 RepID=UPI0036E231E9
MSVESLSPVKVPVLRRPAALRHLGTPAALALVLGVLYLWVSAQELDSIERRTLNRTYIVERVTEHLRLSFTAALLVVVIAVPAGILVTRPLLRRATPLVLVVANAGQAVPAIGLLVLLTIQLDVGFRTAVIGLVASAVLPVLRNTITGIEQVDRSLVETARGMGMRPLQVLLQVELKLAVPVILAGLRTALVFAVGTATIATFVNAGGLGDMIVNGIKLQRMPVLVTGSVLACAVAFLLDWLGSLAESLLKPRGL